MFPEVGAVVMVWDLDKKTPLGLGRYLGKEKIITDDRNDLISEELAFGFLTPKIVLDNGDVIYGFECWWYPA